MRLPPIRAVVPARPRWQPPPGARKPLRVLDATRATPQPSAVIPRHLVPKESDESLQFHAQCPAFDALNIVAVPASGTTIILIGAGASGNGPTVAPVPRAYRAFVDGIFPYLENAAGPITQARIPGSLGVSPPPPGFPVFISWQLLIDNVPYGPYANITTILAPWNAATSDRPLLELRQGSVLTAQVTFVDPTGIYAGGFIGIRIKGRWVPWRAELR